MSTDADLRKPHESIGNYFYHLTSVKMSINGQNAVNVTQNEYLELSKEVSQT